MNTTDQNSFWVDTLVEKITSQRPEGEILVSSGASPSGSYHVGHLREILTADAVVWGLKRAGREARHIHYVDDVDGLRKVPSNVPSDFERYIGTPVYLVPAPEGDGSYSEYFVSQFVAAAKDLGVDMEVIYSHTKYQAGMFSDIVFDALDNMASIREVIETVSGRQLPRDWSPFQILDSNNKLNDATSVSHDRAAGEVRYTLSDGSESIARPDEGTVKLDWRIDWPARWYKLSVDVEPFGRDHATKGGSYDTGKGVIEQVFKDTAPIPVPYEFINLAGHTKKMSASAGTGITPTEALEVMPPALLRYFVLASRPGVTLSFDTGLGYGRMVDNFAAVESQALNDGIDNGLYALASNNSKERVMTDIPFNHLVTAFQTARRDTNLTLDILSRSEHHDQVVEQKDIIVSFLDNVAAWLDKWAPEELKFELSDELPPVELSDEQRAMLGELATRISSQTNDKRSAQWYHETVHSLREKHGLDPKQAFQALYQVLIGKDSGPKAGWFLETIDPDWLIERFRAASKV